VKTHQKRNCQFEKLLSVRYSNGSDFWAAPDGKLGIDKPISTLTAMLVMSELRIPKEHEALSGAAELVIRAVKSDGRVKIAPKGSIYPCHSALAAAALCRNGYCDSEETKQILSHLTSSRYADGGWRCNKFFYGRGPETEFSNPGVTLLALDAFRCALTDHELVEFDDAVETLLDHWTVKSPVGPCHFGIGKQFMQLEYPFYRYNLFYYVYVLSFYRKAASDHRFLEAFNKLMEKLDKDGNLVVEKTKRQLQQLGVYEVGVVCNEANERLQEINDNISKFNIVLDQ
jgi:hypothetical protein